MGDPGKLLVKMPTRARRHLLEQYGDIGTDATMRATDDAILQRKQDVFCRCRRSCRAGSCMCIDSGHGCHRHGAGCGCTAGGCGNACDVGRYDYDEPGIQRHWQEVLAREAAAAEEQHVQPEPGKGAAGGDTKDHERSNEGESEGEQSDRQDEVAYTAAYFKTKR